MTVRPTIVYVRIPSARAVCRMRDSTYMSSHFALGHDLKHALLVLARDPLELRYDRPLTAPSGPVSENQFLPSLDWHHIVIRVELVL